MREAAQRRVSGPAATPVQAAGGGLEIPGREQNDADVPTVGIQGNQPHEPIPGERDGSTLTHRQVGAVSGPFNGSEGVEGNLDATLSTPTRRERVLEGGGGEAERRFDKREDR